MECQCILYFHAACVHSAHIEKTIVNIIVSETLLKNMCDSNVDDVLYVLGNQRKRDINGVRISPVQFLRD